MPSKRGEFAWFGGGAEEDVDAMIDMRSGPFEILWWRRANCDCPSNYMTESRLSDGENETCKRDIESISDS